MMPAFLFKLPPDPYGKLGTSMSKNFKSFRVAGLLVALFFSIALMHSMAQSVDPVFDISRLAADETAQSQERIDQLDTRIQTLLGDYRANLKQLEQLQRYNASQRRQVEAQRREANSLREDINNIASLQRSIQPLMEDMVDTLADLVEADVPFLVSERRGRVERLREIMGDPSFSPAQRYRLVVEAYQIENEYGRTIEAYRDDIEVDGRRYENVEFLRLGRIALIFRTDDGDVLKRFDNASRSWVNLPRSYLADVRTGSRIAREQIPPDLMFLPVTAPQAGEGR